MRRVEVGSGLKVAKGHIALHSIRFHKDHVRVIYCHTEVVDNKKTKTVTLFVVILLVV